MLIIYVNMIFNRQCIYYIRNSTITYIINNTIYMISYNTLKYHIVYYILIHTKLYIV